MSGSVRTVLGDVGADSLGAVDYHEHLFHRSPVLPGEDLVDPAAGEAEFASLLATGFAGIIDATPIGLGRNPGALARIAGRTGGTIVASTGRHRDAHYAGAEWIDRLDLAAVFERELVIGMAASDEQYATMDDAGPALVDGRPVRAGLIKVGIDYWRISPSERAALDAAAAAHASTGAPIMVHTERASAVFELLGVLGASGVSPTRVAIAHADRNPDPGLHAEIAATGAYLGYDGAARYRDHPESALLDCLAALVDAGYGDRVLLGGDVARRSSFVAHGGMPGLAYLGARYVPRVRARLGEAAARVILVDNPARYLAWSRA